MRRSEIRCYSSMMFGTYMTYHVFLKENWLSVLWQTFWTKGRLSKYVDSAYQIRTKNLPHIYPWSCWLLISKEVITIQVWLVPADTIILREISAGTIQAFPEPKTQWVFTYFFKPKPEKNWSLKIAKTRTGKKPKIETWSNPFLSFRKFCPKKMHFGQILVNFLKPEKLKLEEIYNFETPTPKWQLNSNLKKSKLDQALLGTELIVR